VVGSGIEGVGVTALLYRSDDLVAWDFLGPLCVGRTGETGAMWECPDFFPLAGRHVLVVSPYGKPVYQVGAYGAGRFTAEGRGLVDLGEPYYAPNSFANERGRRIMWGWLRECRSAEAQAKEGWSGAMSLPRVLSLRPDGQLLAEPVPEVEALRRSRREVGGLEVGADSERVLAGIAGDCIEVVARFEPGQAEAFGLKVRRSPGGEEETAIVCDRAAGRLTVERGRSSLNPESDKAHHGDAFRWPDTRPVTLRVFLDRSVIEVYMDGTCLTSRVYPTRGDSLELSVFARGGAARLARLDAWQLEDTNAAEGAR
jgi:beta-fructofuranosidase